MLQSGPEVMGFEVAGVPALVRARKEALELHSRTSVNSHGDEETDNHRAACHLSLSPRRDDTLSKILNTSIFHSALLEEFLG